MGQEAASISSDFDFALGEWEVQNYMLQSRLTNDTTWNTMPATATIFKKMNGMLVMDEFRYQQNDEPQVGSSFRIYNKNTGLWSIYWATTAAPDLGLLPQVTGRFKDGIGTFYGEEDFNGKMVRLRFIWKAINEDLLYWEQAYFDEKKGHWEVNWKMEFSRKIREF